MYLALYRKYRPIDFDSVVGQDSIVKTLRNSIVHNSFSHAYMFFGSRGTGKTSVSKIFARNINCLNPKDGNACGKCDACKVSFSKECIDIIEIDAASNNGVDEIRELRNNVSLVPSDLKYKVYIIDEVHMLSDSAFNALLKTLEEPPSHVVFILATTDPQKVPETIISRCQCFSFKKLSCDIITDRLDFVCKKEKIKIDKEVLRKIALLCDGGLRDALGSLDKLISYNSSNISMDDFYEINGIISDEDIDLFISNAFEGNISSVLNSINDFNNCGKNLIQIVIQIIDYCRNLIVDYYVNKSNIKYSIYLYQKLINSLNKKIVDMKKSDDTRIYFEMFILNFINSEIKKQDISNENVVVEKNISNNNQKEVSDLEIEEKKNDSISDAREDKENIDNKSIDKEVKIEENINDFVEDEVADSLTSSPKIVNFDEINNIRINNSFATASLDLKKEELSKFELLREHSFDQEIGYLVNAILDSNICVVGTENMIISYETDSLAKQNISNYLLLNEIYNKLTKSNKNIAIVSNDEWNKLKKEYVDNRNNRDYYVLKKEPEVLFEEKKKDDIINSAISMFGEDIVEEVE